MKSFRIILFGLLFFGWACTSTKYSAVPEAPIQNNPEYTLIYIIHGDSDYLYHKDGKALLADREALQEAFDVALNATSGEVLIFHQKPEQKKFLLFPKKDRTFYHYRNGELVWLENYSPENAALEREIELLQEHSYRNSRRASLFYFGHEIPDKKPAPYHASQPNREFTISLLSNSLNQLPYPLEIVALSTCNNGTPEVVKNFLDKTDVLIASPQNLHLSYLNSKKVLMIEKDRSISAIALADSIANSSFEELSSFVETDVALSVYDLNSVSNYIDELIAVYSQKNDLLLADSFGEDNQDCQDIDAFRPVLKTDGVTSYYSSSMFGKKAQKKQHSGWGCKR